MTTSKKTAKTKKKPAMGITVPESSTPVIHGYKGFDRDMKCRGFQYKEGESFKHNGKASACNSGFHFCTNPLDVFRYYEPGASIFAPVEGSGQTHSDGEDSKVACTEIKIGLSLKLHDFIGAAVKFMFSRKYEESTSNHIVQDRSASSATGERSASSATGESSAAICTGRWSKAMAGKYGCIALAFWNEEAERMEMRCAETGCGDGSDGKLKADTWYNLDDNGMFVETV